MSEASRRLAEYLLCDSCLRRFMRKMGPSAINPEDHWYLCPECGYATIRPPLGQIGGEEAR